MNDSGVGGGLFFKYNCSLSIVSQIEWQSKGSGIEKCKMFLKMLMTDHFIYFCTHAGLGWSLFLQFSSAGVHTAGSSVSISTMAIFNNVFLFMQYLAQSSKCHL